MKNRKLTKIISVALVGACIFGITPVKADADWIQDSKGWWYSEGSSYSIGWRQFKGEFYYFNENGYMVTGWQYIDGKWYFFGQDGKMAVGVVNDGGKEYYCHSTGVMITGWIEYDDEWHYYNEDGSAKTGWLLDNGKWYYIDGGLMAHDKVVEGYKINHDGVWDETADLSPESAEALKAKQVIFDNDSNFIDTIRQYNFELGRAEETTIKAYTGDNYNIPDEKCYKISAFITANGTKMETVYLVGIESGKLYGSANLENYSMYEFKDNKVIKVFCYQNNEGESLDWHYTSNDKVDKTIYGDRTFIKYDGKYVGITNNDVESIKKKSSITLDDAVQLVLNADGNALYTYKFRQQFNVEIKKGKSVKFKDAVGDKWKIPNNDYYSFEVIDATKAESAYTVYSYLVNKDTKEVYVVPGKEGFSAYKFKDNEKVESYKCETTDSNIDWR